MGLKSDERMNEKLNVAKAEFQSKVHQLESLNQENSREIGRLRLELENKTKQGFVKDGAISVKDSEISSLKQSLENFRLEMKDIQHERTVSEQAIRAAYEAEKNTLLERINQLDDVKRRAAMELAKLSQTNRTIGTSLDDNYRRMVEQQQSAHKSTEQYHGAVKDNF